MSQEHGGFGDQAPDEEKRAAVDAAKMIFESTRERSFKEGGLPDPHENHPMPRMRKPITTPLERNQNMSSQQLQTSLTVWKKISAIEHTAYHYVIPGMVFTGAAAGLLVAFTGVGAGLVSAFGGALPCAGVVLTVGGLIGYGVKKGVELLFKKKR